MSGTLYAVWMVDLSTQSSFDMGRPTFVAEYADLSSAIAETESIQAERNAAWVDDADTEKRVWPRQMFVLLTRDGYLNGLAPTTREPV